MRGFRPILLLLLAIVLGCRSPKPVPEPGAILLHVKCVAGAPTPDELRAWVYDDLAILWDGVRIPPTGSLAVESAQNLGTVLIQAGAFQGKLRIHLQGLASGARILDGTLTVDSIESGNRTFDILLSPVVLDDTDDDGVPDAIDDCPSIANPMQGGCPEQAADAGTDAMPDESAQVDAADDLPLAVPDLRIGVDENGQEGPDGAPATPGDTNVADDLVVDAVPDVPAPNDVDAPAVETGPAMEAGGVDATSGIVDAGGDGANKVDAGGGGDTADAGTDGVDLASCVDGGVCDLKQGAPCAADSECASGACADGVCCTNACLGPCRSCNQPSATGTCQGYPQGTDPELECLNSSTCNGVGACGPTPPPNLPNGQLCSSAGQCLSGFCKDGVCCNTACTAPCESCGAGMCQAVRRTDDVPECAGTMTCNQKGECVAN